MALLREVSFLYLPHTSLIPHLNLAQTKKHREDFFLSFVWNDNKDWLFIGNAKNAKA